MCQKGFPRDTLFYPWLQSDLQGMESICNHNSIWRENNLGICVSKKEKKTHTHMLTLNFQNIFRVFQKKNRNKIKKGHFHQ
jgi:hypothetical protein